MTRKTERQHDSVRSVLRMHTHEDHEALHEHFSFSALFEEKIGLEDYRQLVRRLHGFFAPLDEAILGVLDGSAGNGSGYSYASRSGLLAADMIDLGFSDRAVAEAPLCRRAFDVVTPETLGGVLYVVEGAALGGSSIDRAAQKLLSDERPDGRRYWSWCRSEAGSRWAMSNIFLEDLIARGAAIEDLKRGAGETFRLFADWLAPLDRSKSPAAVERS